MDKLKIIPMVLFLSYVGKLLILQANLADAPIVATLALLTAYFEFSPTNKQLKEIDVQLKEVNTKLVEAEKNVEHLKTHVSGLKLSQQMRTSNVR